MLRKDLFNGIAAAGDRETVLSLVNARAVSGTALLRAADAVAGHLKGLSTVPQGRVLAVLPNGLALLTLYLACLRHRFIVCPVSPDSPAQDVDYIRSVFRPDVIVDPEALDACVLAALDTDEDGAAGAGAGDLPDYAPNDIFSVNFTSGTTGRPKGVAHYAERMLGNAAAFNDRLGCGAEQRMMHVMPMYYMAGLLNTLLCPLMAGGAVILAPALVPRTALSFWRQVVDAGVNAFWLSPTMLRMVMKLDRTKDSRDYAARALKHALVGTAPMAPDLAAEFQERYAVRPLQSYGLSELLLVSCDDAGADGFGGVGALIDGVEAVFAADGELALTTAYLFAGYLDPESGAIVPQQAGEAFVTGDLAEIDRGGRLRITGRKKDLIVVGGINVSPAAIEERLQGVAGVGEIAVLGEGDEVYGEVPVAYVLAERAADRDALLQRLSEGAREGLPAFSRPARFYFVDTMPTGPTGKVQKRLLVRPEAS